MTQEEDNTPPKHKKQPKITSYFCAVTPPKSKNESPQGFIGTFEGDSPSK